MNKPLVRWIRQQQLLLAPPQDRRRLLAFAQTLTFGTRLTPTPAEQRVLDQFVRGELSYEQLLACLEAKP